MSTQVLNELVNVLAYKLRVKTKEETREIISDLMETFEVSIITNQMIVKAIEISIKYQYRFFDSLMISCALEKGCKILYSEDMQDNQVIEDTLTIINPFRR
ncbi:MAG: PIN domain-containing protein [Bacteroidales bacterium]|nr:PIN domain-containing protein [Bacteroidales bacterium]MCF8454319.1 PIN domain-containing protein [Bacteroidales bacterium]